MSEVHTFSKRFLIGPALLAVIAAALVWATPGSQFTTTVLQRSISETPIEIRIHPPVPVLDENGEDRNAGTKYWTDPPALSDILVQQVTAPPGGYSGWHSHPGTGLVAVRAGVVAIYSGDDPTCTPKYVAAGGAFIEEAGHVHMVRNEGTVPYEAYSTFVLPAGIPSRTDEPNPGHCPF